MNQPFGNVPSIIHCIYFSLIGVEYIYFCSKLLFGVKMDVNLKVASYNTIKRYDIACDIGCDM